MGDKRVGILKVQTDLPPVSNLTPSSVKVHDIYGQFCRPSDINPPTCMLLMLVLIGLVCRTSVLKSCNLHYVIHFVELRAIPKREIIKDCVCLFGRLNFRPV
jgi:hypothetical protein